MDIFNPSLCLTKELKNSWAANLVSAKSDDKIPIEIAQGVPRLRLEHNPESSEDWFACAIPLSPDWEPVDMSNASTLKFTIYMDEDCGGLVRLEDANGVESADFELENAAAIGGEEHNISVSMEAFKIDELDFTKIKTLKVIGYKGAAFYLSEIVAD